MGTATANPIIAVADVIGAAPLASPAFTGVPTAPTAAPGTDTTQVATTAFAKAEAAAAAAALVGAAPADLDTIHELAAELQDEQSAVAAITTSLAGKVPQTRTISTTSPLTGGGDLSDNRTISMPAATAASAGHATAAQITKLDGIATGATANASDAALRARSSHTGTQSVSTITGAGTAALVNTGTTSGTVPLLGTGGSLTLAGGINLTPVAGVNPTISFGLGYNAAALHLYDGGAAVRYGWGMRAAEMQFFLPASTHFSWNKGGDLQPAGTNQIMSLDANTGSLLMTGPIESVTKIGIGKTAPSHFIDSAGALATGTVGTEIAYRHTRGINGGTSYPQAFAIAVGRYAAPSSFSPNSRADFLLKHSSDGSETPEVLAMSLYSDGTMSAQTGIFSGTVKPGVYTVGTLPTPGTAGRTAYASNGRKNGEGAAAGTGVLVFDDGTAWRASDTGTTVAA